MTNISPRIARVLQKRLELAQEQFNARIKGACEKYPPQPVMPWDWWRYGVDFAQRSVLFWDTMRRRGNQFIERESKGLPPVLSFDYEMVLDGRSLDRPVNYALVRILPPAGVKVDDQRRPYVIIDPRAGHGPGIGGFKDDSQVGVAIREGHPVYFVIFFPEPQPGQTLLDVCAAERDFVRRVRELHPDAPKPAIVGNCQGGWAAMMLAASNPEDTGPIVINGAPMSYWGGAWNEGEGDNPMRYAGGLLGGTWLASLTSDLGAGKFDGAHLVQNFENLNPANTFWDKYYHVFANVDTEPARFLDFERWWGGFYLMNREEIEWITNNLFVGNKLWQESGFDLRQIRSPVILFASIGDNITPPQQAFNWVADVYGSTDEIKARGQVIVGLVHEDIGHLGIFVSGSVAKKEHAQIVSVLKSIEALPPGLYAMKVEQAKDGYAVSFTERRLEEIIERLNRFKRVDEKPFEAVAAVSDFNQRAYELFARPLVQAFASEQGAKLARDFHPLRFQRWIFSDRNPWMAWLPAAAGMAKAQRQALGADDPLRKSERLMSEMVSASLDYYRAVRDALSEAAFFQLYGNLFALQGAKGEPTGARERPAREEPLVQEALAAIDKGGYPAALARAAFLLARKGEPLPLARIELKHELMKDYREFMPDVPRDEARRLRGMQEIIVGYEPDKALAALPVLLADAAERERFLTFIERLLVDRRVQALEPGADQLVMLARIRSVLGVPPTGPRRRHKPRVAAS
jgi:pimeloyl-ACP methyl ester carboxylesterase